MTSELFVPEDTTAGVNHVPEIVPPLDGACTVRLEDEEFPLPGRESVCASVTDVAYAPHDARTQIASGAGGRFALAGAKCERQLPARYGPAPEVSAEERGACLLTHSPASSASTGPAGCRGRSRGRPTTGESTARTVSPAGPSSPRVGAAPTPPRRSVPATPLHTEGYR
ncbi:5-deoxy-glucuronate isomerase [Streptomyces sp. NPDC092370]|uniref:5-deoxy-glucuronate isomerase n=1 Tax=Streptomyces sp. NPDC092370 TaxID=3366016 RepID=UPI00380BCC1E